MGPSEGCEALAAAANPTMLAAKMCMDVMPYSDRTVLELANAMVGIFIDCPSMSIHVIP